MKSDRPRNAQPLKATRRKWAGGLTVVIVAITVGNIFSAHENPLAAKLADFGQWLSGVAGALAFVWLIVSYLQQGEELELQREELAATREQLSLQKDEMARFADQAERQASSANLMETHTRQNIFFSVYGLILAEARGALIDLGSSWTSRIDDYVNAGDAGLQRLADAMAKDLASKNEVVGGILLVATRIPNTNKLELNPVGTQLIQQYGHGGTSDVHEIPRLHRFIEALSPIEILASSTQQQAMFEELERTSAFLRLRAVARRSIALAEKNTRERTAN